MTIALTMSKQPIEPPADITAGEVEEILGRGRFAVLRLVRSGKLVPTRKLPGRTGAFLFDRAAVIALAEEWRAELAAELEAASKRIGAA